MNVGKWHHAYVTLTAAWIRQIGNVEELIVASDSRLRGGEAWDCCPKILTLPREDCVIAFAGNTWWAYPLMLQMANAIALHPGSMSRKVDIVDLKGHVLRVFEQMLDTVHDLPNGQERPDRPLKTEFLFGGYSWKSGGFRVWKLHFDTEIDRYTFRRATPWRGQERGAHKVVAFAGDAAGAAKERLDDLLKQRDKNQTGSFDMEPFEILRDIIRDGSHPTVGGPPQLVKVYRFARTQAFAVAWPDARGSAATFGRQALGYESYAAPLIDPDNPTAFGPPREYSNPMAQEADTQPDA